MRLALWVLLLASGASKKPAPPPPAALKPSALLKEVRVSADTLQVFGKEGRAVYLGHARATRDTAVITCDRLTVFQAKGEVTRVEADGNVEVQDGDLWARGAHADFDNATGVLEVTGAPEAKQKQAHVTGTTVTFTVGSDLLEVRDPRTVFAGDAAQRVPGAAKPSATKAPAPVLIDADHLRVFGQKQQAVWSGKVKARRGATRIRTERLIAFYGADREVTRVEAAGRVEVDDGDRSGRGEHAQFDNRTGVLVVTGNPEARQGSNWVKGSRVTFHAGTDKLEIEQAESLIHTHVQPPEPSKWKKP